MTPSQLIQQSLDLGQDRLNNPLQNDELTLFNNIRADITKLLEDKYLYKEFDFKEDHIRFIINRVGKEPGYDENSIGLQVERIIVQLTHLMSDDAEERALKDTDLIANIERIMLVIEKEKEAVDWIIDDIGSGIEDDGDVESSVYNKMATEIIKELKSRYNL